MSESTVQLPPNSTGAQIRTTQGDGTTTLIPTGVQEELVIPSDDQGMTPGDSRQLPTAVVLADEMLLFDIRRVLLRIELVLKAAFDSDVADDMIELP